MTDSRLPILVTAIGGGGHGEQVLKALRLANDGRYRLIGADANPRSPQFALVDDAVTLPLASASNYLDVLFHVISKYRIKAVFHGCEPELRLFSMHRDKFAEAQVFLPINPAEVIDLCMDKASTNRRLAELGFRSPRCVALSTRAELDAIDFFPVVVKPSVGGGGSANVYVAQTAAELLGLTDYLGLESHLSGLLVQEYVGTPEQEFTVGVLHDMEGKYLNAIAVRRSLSGQMNIRMTVPNRTGRTDLGPRLVISSGISQGHVGRFPEVSNQCAGIARAIGSRGPINLQCRLMDDHVMIFEINPRFSGTTSLRAMMGFNEPDILIRKHLFGEHIEVDFGYREGFVSRTLQESIVQS